METRFRSQGAFQILWDHILLKHSILSFGRWALSSKAASIHILSQETDQMDTSDRKEISENDIVVAFVVLDRIYYPYAVVTQ